MAGGLVNVNATQGPQQIVGEEAMPVLVIF
jgi:hypothetical protein